MNKSQNPTEPVVRTVPESLFWALVALAFGLVLIIEVALFKGNITSLSAPADGSPGLRQQLNDSLNSIRDQINKVQTKVR
ncbi:hypothetical protein HY224_00330 [Candidatus Uhrbacteria bacterium]|nr:hypothetical protein [Candidatus Uhrbacteria bacterium]